MGFVSVKPLLSAVIPFVYLPSLISVYRPATYKALSPLGPRFPGVIPYVSA
jgi:hypothetical protein